MTDEEKEIYYQLSMKLAKTLRERRVITEEQYEAFGKEMAKKYDPRVGRLFWAKSEYDT